MTKVLPISRFTIHGNSMVPTLRPGQDVLSFNWAYLGEKPKVGDMVVIKHQGKELVKRVKEVEGKRVFVVGDNLGESTDSRHFGMIDIDQITGRMVYTSSEVPCSNCGFKLTCCE